VASLMRLVSDFDVAEEAVQEAFAAALAQWQSSGVPESLQAWIVQTAGHKGRKPGGDRFLCIRVLVSPTRHRTNG
jgi:predicted RNA polymerase sigma factor